MLDEANCRGLLERVLEIPIGNIEVDKEKNIVYRPEFKGVRLDVYAKDDAIKRDREMGKRYMLLEEFLMRERQRSMELGMAKGTAKSILSILAKKAPVLEELSNHIMNETNLQTLAQWLEIAVSADSIERFMEDIHFTF